MSRWGRIVAVGAGLACVLPGAAMAAERPLKVRGGALVDDRGRQVILHGVNVVVTEPGYIPHTDGPEARRFGARDVARLRRWGFDAVRIGVPWSVVMPEPGQVSRRALDRIESVVRRATEGGLFVVVGLHQDGFARRFDGFGAPAWAVRDGGRAFDGRRPFPYDTTSPAMGRAFTALWDDEDGIRTQYAAAWTALARRFRGEERVVGHHLINAPACDVSLAPCGLPPGPGAGERFLMPFYEQLVPAVRRADPTHPVLVSDWASSAFGYPAQLGTPPGPAWPFPGQILAHGVTCGAPLNPDPCARQREQAFAQARGAARRMRAAPLVTTFGAHDDVADVRDIVEMAGRREQGWLFTAYKPYGDSRAHALVSSGGDPRPTRLRALAVPYPQRIAGRDARWSFDRERRRFELRYRPRGRADTIVALPEVQYRRGTDIRVRGADARLDRRGDTLRLRARRGAERVTLVVTPD